MNANDPLVTLVLVLVLLFTLDIQCLIINIMAFNMMKNIGILRSDKKR